VLAAGAAEAPRPLPWALVLAAVLLLVGGVAASAALHRSAAPHPGPFYATPSRLPHGPPGTLIRYELIPHFYPGAKAYRVLYKSTGLDGRATAVSGLVVVPEGPAPRGGRKVIAFTHGTVGVANSCAPSLQPGDAAQVIQGLGGFIAAGYVVAASDYAGLGTAGASPDLIGRVEAIDALDSVRAAHRLRAAHAGVEFAIWGHAAGGQAALFTAELAPTYAPGLRLAGVAAGAPVSDLVDLFRSALKTDVAKAGASEASVGRVLVAMALASWQGVYGSAQLGRTLTPSARSALAQITRYCLYGREALAAIPSAAVADFSFRHSPPWGHQPWRAIAAANSPGALAIAVPVLITQGGADRIVPPAITARFVRALCAHGAHVQERRYESVGHLEAGIVVAPDVAAWIGERFAGRAATSSCAA
jgi:pimeloyl-ACP methyl ester carboxylesterase